MNDLIKQRSYPVILSNTLAKSRHQLSLQEQKAILYIVSKIKPNTDDLNYKFNIRDYMKVCGLKNSGKNYSDLRNTLTSLSDKSWMLENEDNGEWVQVRWLNKAKGNKNSGEIEIRIDEDLKPYLIGLKENFTEFELVNILALTSNYAVQLYQILKSYCWTHKWIVSVEDFREQLMLHDVASYKRWNDLRRSVIDVAIKQINEFTDLNVLYKDNGGKGKKTTQIAFVINLKSNTQIDEIRTKVNNILDCASISDDKADESLLAFVNMHADDEIPFPITAKEVLSDKEQIKLNIEYNSLIKDYEKYSVKIDQIVTLMSDVVASPAQTVRVNGAQTPWTLVKERLLSLKKEHIIYVIQSMEATLTPIKNVRSYLLSSLFNAPLTISDEKEMAQDSLIDDIVPVFE